MYVKLLFFYLVSDNIVNEYKSNKLLQFDY
jgi:hypothetical protein